MRVTFENVSNVARELGGILSQSYRGRTTRDGVDLTFPPARRQELQHLTGRTSLGTGHFERIQDAYIALLNIKEWIVRAEERVAKLDEEFPEYSTRAHEKQPGSWNAVAFASSDPDELSLGYGLDRPTEEDARQTAIDNANTNPLRHRTELRQEYQERNTKTGKEISDAMHVQLMKDTVNNTTVLVIDGKEYNLIPRSMGHGETFNEVVPFMWKLFHRQVVQVTIHESPMRLYNNW